MDRTAQAPEAIRLLLERGPRGRLSAALAAVHPADIARLLGELPLEHQVEIIRMLSPDRAGEVLSEADDQTLLDLVRALGAGQVSRILERMPPDHAAEVVEELSEEEARAVLGLMGGERSAEVQELLEHPEGTAGRLMSPGGVTVPEGATAAQAIEQIRKSAREERSFEVYVVDDQQRVVGVVPLRRLLVADPATPVRALREPVVAVRPETDGEEVARLVARYDLLAVPVVDDGGRLLGTISVEDIIDVLDEEASEDIFRLAGSDVEELERRPPARIALMRLPWLLATVAIELGAGAVIHAYDATLSRVILLASFMPVIQAISGNTGLQSVTMVVRGLATGHVRLERWWEPLRRQLQTTAIIGVVCGALVGLVGALWHGTAAFGVVVGVSMFVSVNLSGLAGTGIPMLSRRLGFDPAMTAGPFETAFQDVIGVTIFLSLATLLLHWLV
jgi:magnesium transporter